MESEPRLADGAGERIQMPEGPLAVTMPVTLVTDWPRRDEMKAAPLISLMVTAATAVARRHSSAVAVHEKPGGVHIFYHLLVPCFNRGAAGWRKQLLAPIFSSPPAVPLYLGVVVMSKHPPSTQLPRVEGGNALSAAGAAMGRR